MATPITKHSTTAIRGVDNTTPRYTPRFQFNLEDFNDLLLRVDNQLNPGWVERVSELFFCCIQPENKVVEFNHIYTALLQLWDEIDDLAIYVHEQNNINKKDWELMSLYMGMVKVAIPFLDRNRDRLQLNYLSTRIIPAMENHEVLNHFMNFFHQISSILRIFDDLFSENRFTPNDIDIIYNYSTICKGMQHPEDNFAEINRIISLQHEINTHKNIDYENKMVTIILTSPPYSREVPGRIEVNIEFLLDKTGRGIHKHFEILLKPYLGGNNNPPFNIRDLPLRLT
ncbi:MAG: hypothetical protein KBD37_05835 [Burkholderiales bacterium]|nr:hypothetical protein [Burkholderiales bacterium]